MRRVTRCSETTETCDAGEIRDMRLEKGWNHNTHTDTQSTTEALDLCWDTRSTTHSIYDTFVSRYTT